MSELVLFTEGFPYGKGESFLETEIEYLSGSFSQVRIFTVDPVKGTPRKLPKNCSVSSIHIPLGFLQKLMAIRFIFTSLFWQEMDRTRKEVKRSVNARIVKTALISLYRANEVNKNIQDIVNDTSSKVFYSYWCDDSSLALALQKKDTPQLKCCSRVHGWDLYYEMSDIGYLPFRKFIAEELDLIVPISDYGREYIIEKWNTNRAKIATSRLGVRASPFLEKTVDKKEFMILSCSNLINLKRVDLIAEALALIEEEISLKWVHIGDGPEYDKVKKMTDNISNKQIKIELKGQLMNQQVMEFYKTNRPDIFLNVSMSEGIPVSIMEAMSFGVPVIATKVGGTSEIVNQENGSFLPSQPTAEMIKNELLYFINLSKTDQEKYSEEALKTWKNKFNAAKNYPEFIQELRSL